MRQDPHSHPMNSMFENMRQEEGDAVYRALRIIRGEGTGCLWRHLARGLITKSYAKFLLEKWPIGRSLVLTDSGGSPSDDGGP